MPGNQQFVGPFLAQHLDSHQHWRHNDRMKTVHSDCLYWMQTLDCIAIFSCKGDVSPQVSDRTARLQPTHDIAFRQVLVFQAHGRMGKDSSFSQHSQRLPRKP
jgi:hypothetical protein